MLRDIIEVTVFYLLIVKGVCVAEETSVSVTEGDSVVLHSDLTDTLPDHHILWMFGDQENRIAEIYRKNPPIYESEGQFRDRLMMDSKTGSLTITNITTEDAGLYKLQIISRNTSYKRFRVSVYARLPVPVIMRDSSHSSNSSSVCVLVCSVENVSDVTLSWYKGESFFSSISVSDLSRRLSLSLEIQCLDDSYNCVLNNTITHQNTHLNISQLCQTCSGHNHNQTTLIIIVLPLILLLCLTTFIIIQKKRSSFCKKREDESEEMDYSKPTFSAVRPLDPEDSLETVYSTVKT